MTLGEVSRRSRATTATKGAKKKARNTCIGSCCLNSLSINIKVSSWTAFMYKVID